MYSMSSAQYLFGLVLLVSRAERRGVRGGALLSMLSQQLAVVRTVFVDRRQHLVSNDRMQSRHVARIHRDDAPVTTNSMTSRRVCDCIDYGDYYNREGNTPRPVEALFSFVDRIISCAESHERHRLEIRRHLKETCNKKTTSSIRGYVDDVEKTVHDVITRTHHVLLDT